MMLVKCRLKRKCQYRAQLFSYPSIRGTLNENFHLLADFIAGQEFDKVHLIGHSLGGVVALCMFALKPDTPVYRVVCLGSPLCGSRVASHLNQVDWGKVILGKSVTDGAVGEVDNQ
jgi:pimeloyl-ACP methyl ester carboxylesterase